MARILITENQSFFAKALATDLVALGHSFLWAENHIGARALLEREDFDCIIIDGKMAGFSGVQFSQWVQLNKPTPTVIMADFADQANPATPYGLAGVALLVKPFTRDGIRAALTAAIPANSPYAAFTSAREAMIPVPKAALRKAGVAEYAIFRYVNGNPVAVLKHGEPYILEKLGLPPATRFYTDRESLKSLLATSLTLTASAVGNSKITPEKRAALMQETVKLANEQMSLMEIDPKTSEATVEILSTYLKSVDDGAVWEMIANLDTFSRPIYAQTLASTLICLMIAQEQKYSVQDCFKLTTAALFHDVGLTSLDPVLLKTSRALLSMKDRQTVDRHVEIGVSILQKAGWISQEVCTIVWQHHESDIGNGFPRALKAQQLHPMARILRIADEFCLSVMKTGGQRGVPPLRALDLLKDRRELDQKSVLSLHRILTAVKQQA
ncbi:MAG: HD domain-containing phosphohydrolase [Bdellovibrionales bacterium]